MIKRKKIWGIIFLSAGLVLAGGCGNNNVKEESQPVEVEESAEQAEEAVEPEEPEAPAEEEGLKENEMYSLLTGTPILKEKGEKRPVGVMINNIRVATPQQAGLNSAAIVYEAPVEGYITRFMAIFDDYENVKAIGSIRSARTYYVRYCNEFDGILLHVGQAYNAKKLLSYENSITENVGGPVFRIKTKKAPHNAFTTGEKLTAYFNKNSKLRQNYKKERTFFQFNKEATELPEAENIVTANKIDLQGCYPVNKPWYEYDSESGKYKRFQFGAKQLDANDGNQVEADNVIIEFAKGNVFDKKGRWNINETAGGNGYFITKGKSEKIKWKFVEGKTRYYDSKTGDEIKLNPGKTWVNIIIDNKASSVKFE